MYLHSPKLFVIIVLLSLIILPFVAPLSFNFSSFSPDDPIKYERSASSENNQILLTSERNEIARATYAKPIQLWDNSTRNMANFNTHFSFVIDSHHQANYSGGLAFFLAPNGSRIPNGTTKGSTLGLTADNEQLDSTDKPFVAVEFDIFPSGGSRPSGVWDAPNEHVGIDINSVKSVNYTTWHPNILDGRQNDAWISYDSTSINLSVVFTGFASDNVTVIQQGLYYKVDLREHLPEWVTVGFSASTAWLSINQSILSWNFISTDLPPTRETNKGKAKLWVRLGPILAGGIVLVVLVFVVSILACRKWRNRPQNNSQNNPDELEVGVQGPKKLSYKELARATNNFAESNKLGEGGFGGVYRGYLRKLDLEVAVKKKWRDSPQGMKAFKSEVKTISGLRYRNLVRLIGWCHKRKGLIFRCHEEEQLLLVYEFMPNRSLHSHLHDDNTPLPWVKRYKIAKGLASALLYLHEEWEPNRYVVHRDIKSENVLLDSNFNAKLGDFGLARIVKHGQQVQTSEVMGTRDYMAPECFDGINPSKESDVYSFGTVVLEIATGRMPNGPQHHRNQRNVVNLVRQNFTKGNLMGSADRRLAANFDEQEMKRLLIVGLWCANLDQSRRPLIREVVRALNSNNEDSLPDVSSQICRRPSITEVVPALNSNNEDSLPGVSSQIFDPPVNNHASSTSSASYVSATGGTG